MTTIDPSKVKAGDTVTVAGTNTAHLEYTVTGVVWKPSHSPGQLWVGPVALDATTLTITAHEPAESEWEPGTVGTATIEGVADVPGTWVRSRNGSLYFATHEAAVSTGNLAYEDMVTDFVPDDAEALRARVAELESDLAASRDAIESLSSHLDEAVERARVAERDARDEHAEYVRMMGERDEARAEVECLRAAMDSSTHSILAQGWHHEGYCPARTLPTKEQFTAAFAGARGLTLWPGAPGSLTDRSARLLADAALALIEQDGAS